MSLSDPVETAAARTGWGTAPLWTVARRVDRKGFPDAELLSVYRDWGVVRKADRDDNFNVESDDLTSYKFVQRGDLVLNKMKTWQGSLGVSDFEGIVSPAYFTCELSSTVHPRFIHYLLRSDLYIAMYAAASKGIRPNQWDLPYEAFRSVNALLPPLEEQRRIADFLDEHVARIDDMMRLRTSQTSLLEQAWHSQRFEILSQVAAGAPLRRLGSISMIHSGAGFPVEEQGLDIGDLPFVKVADLSLSTPDGTLATAGNFVSSLTARKLGARVAPPGTILFPKVGAALLTNRRALLGVPAVFDNNVMGVRFKVGEPRYFLHAMSCIDLGLLANPGPVPSVNESAVKEIQLAVPQLSSQKAAIRQLDDAMGATANGVGRLNTSLSLLSEYKRSLITAAVTAELDVTTARRGIPA